MAVSKKTSIKIEARNKAPQAEKYGIRKGFWLHSALALLAFYSLYVVITYITGTGRIPVSANPIALLDPTTSSLLIVAFSVLYFYAVARKVAASTITNVAACILVTVASLALLVTIILSGQYSSSSDDFYFRFSVLFHNPYISALTSTTSIIGGIAIVTKLIRR